ncbi:MAG TPA: anti-sigma factor [Candidatus Acidoferrales bacterium]|nr:anti-sigma factor [Candidatus Acidoferrales bacterium]
MSCDLPRTVLHGYFDGELDPVRAAEFETHLEHCPECVAAFEAEESLRSSIKSAQLYEKAPAPLRSKVLSQTRRHSRFPARLRLPLWTWVVATAAVILFAFAGWRILPGPRNNSQVLAAEILDAHLRSLQPGHLVDVTSSDQHTVKPWFDGRLDFSPPVPDFAEEAFPLRGGRLDAIDAHSVAVLVYGRRKHVVNVFLWPVKEADAAPRSGSLQGYHWIVWRKGGMEFWVVSDTSLADLEELQKLFSQ